MDLTLESAFSTGGLVGHLAYILLVASMLMRQMVLLRVLVIASALVAILYATVWLRDPVTLFWETTLVLVNIVQLLITWRSNRKARFTEEEQALITARFAGLGRHEARRLLDLGQWRDGAAGERLTEQDAPVPALVYLHRGSADILLAGHKVATCRAGNFIGEMSLVDDGLATATAVLAGPARLWALPGAAVARLRRDEERLSAALDLAITQDLKTKLISANQRSLRAAQQ